MCSLAPRAAAAPAAGFGIGGATAFLDRHRGVAAAAVAVVPAATSSGHNAGEPTRRARARASEASTAPARKRGRHDDGFEHVAVDTVASSALRSRMDKELVALQGLLKRAKLLPRSAAPHAEKKCAPAPPRPSEAPSAGAKRTTTTSQPKGKEAATEAACHQTQITARPANSKQQQQQRPVQRAAAKNPIAVDVPNKQRPAAEAPAAAKPKRHQQQQHPVQRAAAAAKTTEVPKKRRPEEEEEKERARAAEREEFRQMLLEMEKAALPDETIYPEDLEELGIPFEFVVTRTWKQACLDHAKKVELVGA